MDYKSRFPQLPRWPHTVLETARHPMPYVDPGFGSIQELDAPDKSAVFLTVGSSIIREEETIIQYLLEAPVGYPMRDAFENGEISIADFADHRGWLIRLQTKLFCNDDLIVNYVHPTQVDAEARHYFKCFEDVGPYQRLLNGLISIRNIHKKIGQEYKSLDAEIQNLLETYPSKFAA